MGRETGLDKYPARAEQSQQTSLNDEPHDQFSANLSFLNAVEETAGAASTRSPLQPARADQSASDTLPKLSLESPTTEIFDLNRGIVSFAPLFCNESDLKKVQSRRKAPLEVPSKDKPTPEEALKLHSARLTTRVEGELSSNEDLRIFVKQPEWFRKRLDELAKDSKFSAGDKVAFVEQLERLMDPTIKGIAPLADRAVLAGQMLDQALDIKTIDQGIFKTCTMGVMEKLMYSRDLDKVARLVTDVALTGATKLACGKTIKIDSDSLLGGPHLKREVPPPDNIRSLASQYFALIGTNARLQTLELADRNYRYAHEEGADVLQDVSTNPPGYVYESRIDRKLISVPKDQLAPAEFEQVNHPLVYGGKVFLDLYESLTHRPAAGIAISGPLPSTDDSRIVKFKNADELRQTLERRSEKEFPVVLIEPGHVATIDGFNRRTGLADYDNQWGDDNDRFGADGIDMKELFRVSMGDHSKDKASKAITHDALATRRDEALSKLSSEDLNTQLANALADSSKLGEALKIAHEIKSRADIQLSTGDRQEARQSIRTLQEWLRDGKRVDRDDKGDKRETPLSDVQRLQVHEAIAADLGSLHQQIEARKFLGALQQRAGLFKDAEATLVEIQKLSDFFPQDQIAEQARLMQAESKKPYTEDIKRWLDSSASRLGTKPDPFKPEEWINMRFESRINLALFYSGYQNDSLTGDVFNAEKANRVVQELRATMKSAGVDLDEELKGFTLKSGEPPKNSKETIMSQLRTITLKKLQANMSRPIVNLKPKK